jgi:TonB family protein
LEVPALRDANYYPVASLDEYPRPLSAVDPCYPHGASGEVALLLLIDDTGVVNEVSVLEAKPEGLFTAGAIQACRELRFSPGRKDGRPVRSRVRLVLGQHALSAAPSQ